jgi:hypothetical protein
MALGGGIFTTQNKVLPGSYINFVSAARASAQVSDRGYAAIALSLDWGAENAVTEVTSEDLQLRSTKLFGYDYTSDKLKELRELFLNARVVYLYRLNSGGTKATNAYATALYGGIRGNDITINSLVTTTDTKGEVFKENQTVIICDNIANDIADIFNTRYLGVVPNDNAGRTSLWSDIVKYYEQLETIRAIEDFDEADVTVTQGDSKKAVVVNSAITVINAMAQLYMTVTVG